MYRSCAGVMLFNKKGKIFAGKRVNVTGKFSWQMPQGGIRSGESYVRAALRELKEETSIVSVKITAKLDRWIYYDLPEEYKKSFYNSMYKGQCQKWILLFFVGDDSEINIDTEYKEFSSWKWVNADSMLSSIVDFKSNTYKEVFKEFMPIIDQYISSIRDKK